jgi:hypothetical protein
MMVLFLTAGMVFSADMATVFDIIGLGGQNSYKGDTSSFSGNINFDLVPAIKFSDKFSLLPMYNLEYREIKQVRELADGNILFQKGLNNNIALKPIITLKSGLKLKFRAGYMQQQLQEAASESLANGAFNYNKITVGAEIANGDSYSAGYNMYSIAYPNYGDLVEKNPSFSVVASSVQTLGKNILDFMAHEVYFAKKFELGQAFTLDGIVDYTMKNFSDQKTALDISNVSSTKRTDNSILINIFPSMAIVPTGPTTVFGGLSLNYLMYNSNQNYADTNFNKFISNYYNFNEIKIAPIFNFSFNKIPLKLGVSYEMAMRTYTDRLAQDSSGNYTGSKMTLNTNYYSINLSYPILDNLNALLIYSNITSSSNMKYESVYQYNYDANSIFAGVKYMYE